nr:50S ribosomal protein L24 [Candidatus Endolissoclinum faulkneri]
MSARIRKGDWVIVITGRDRGKMGKVLRVMPSDNRLVIEGVNIIKRHTRPNQNSPGGIIEREAAIDISNVMHIDPASNKSTRIRFEERDGNKVRVAKRSGQLISTHLVVR